MKKITVLLCTATIFLSAFSLNANEIDHQIESIADQTSDSTEEIGDLFPGTIELQENRYILKRCTSGGYDYILNFSNKSDQQKIDQLIKLKTKFWVNIFGVYSAVNDEHHLKIKQTPEIFLDQNCHLSDILQNISQNNESKKIESDLPLSI